MYIISMENIHSNIRDPNFLEPEDQKQPLENAQDICRFSRILFQELNNIM